MTRAAQALHVGQPALTQAIQGLERELGVELFARTGRGVALTPAGQVLVAAVNRALDELDTAAARIEVTTRRDDTIVVLAARPAAALAPGVELIARGRGTHPDIRIRLLTVEHVEEVATLVTAGDADIGLTDLPRPFPGLLAHEITRHTFLAFLPPGTPVPGPTIGWSDLGAYPLIGAPRADPRWQHVDALLLASGTTGELAVETTQREILLPLVEAGVGAGVGYGYWREEAERRGIVVIPFDTTESRPVGLLRLRRPLTEAAERWWDSATGRVRPTHQFG